MGEKPMPDDPNANPGSDPTSREWTSMRCVLDDGRIHISHIGTPNVPSSEISKRTPPPKKEGK
jgi:hypothetical protein